jgi:hypothetical protein
VWHDFYLETYRNIQKKEIQRLKNIYEINLPTINEEYTKIFKDEELEDLLTNVFDDKNDIIKIYGDKYKNTEFKQPFTTSFNNDVKYNKYIIIYPPNYNIIIEGDYLESYPQIP